MILVERLSKRFQGASGLVHAVRELSFTAHPGQICGLLGPNGAGKSTTIRIIGTLLQADEGKVTVAGHDVQTDPASVRRAIGFVSPDTGL
jgi:ABC-type Na+ transport system ATPase subunit NatA